ncbi:MAG: beta-lactamase family protein [Acetobacterium sp.]|nr:beta-lactamase family protein [Acetobacterium sp.]
MLKKRLTVVILSILLVLVPLSGCEKNAAQSQTYEKTIATARTEIWKEISGRGAASATIAIMENGKIVYQEGFSKANRLTAKDVDTHTQYNIGSVSKVFTAAAIMQLVEAGKLELDKPVVDYLPDFTMKDSRYRVITVRMLLNHSSGLPGTMLSNGFATEKDPDFLTNFMAYLANSSLKDDPGVVSVYCNDGFTLAEVLIEKISGQHYADYLETHFFSKADMTDSSCSFKNGNDNIALKYNNEDGSALPREIINLIGTGGISSTAADLCRFGNALLSDKLLSAASFTEYTSPQYGPETVPSGTPTDNYGLGWDMVAVPTFAEQGVTVIGKNGATFQYASQLYLIPEANLSIALIFAGTANVAGIADKITQTLLEEKGIIPANETAAKTITPTAIPNDILGFAGYYGASGSVIKIDFDQQANTLVYQQFDGQSFVTAATYPYLGDGYFDMQNDQWLSFSENFGKKLLLQSMAHTTYGTVIGEDIKANNPVDTSRFEGKRWLPLSLSATDFTTFSAATGSIPELPGTIYFGSDGSYTPYPLKDQNTGYMNLAYARDLCEPIIKEENGKTTMTAMSHTLLDVADIPGLQKAETIRIEKSGENVIRRLDADGRFGINLRGGGRLVIYDPSLAVVYDTLYGEIKDVPVTAGSYVMFIGTEGESFPYDYTL